MYKLTCFEGFSVIIRMFIFVCFLVVSVANCITVPRDGYNYQIQIDPSLSDELSPEQHQLLQQFAKQQLNEEHPSHQTQAAVRPLPEQNHQDHLLQKLTNPIVVKPEPISAFRNGYQPLVRPEEHLQPSHQQHKPQQFHKEFFYLTAPNDEYERPQDLDQQIENLRKNIRVIFIRAPEQNGATDAAVQLAKQSLEQQTIIYVLTKQPDTAELANKLQQVQSNVHSKPDVIFVKYKTAEEAEHAQRTIQAQYEALKGPNHFNHQDLVSTHNFVGSTANRQKNRVHIDPRKSASNVEADAPNQIYLPQV